MWLRCMSLVRRLTQKACRTEGKPDASPEASAASPATQDTSRLWEQGHDGFVEAVASLPALQAGQGPCQLEWQRLLHAMQRTTLQHNPTTNYDMPEIRWDYSCAQST